MACCLTAPSHYLNQCWFLFLEVLWHSPESDFTANTQAFILYNEIENFNNIAISLRDQGLFDYSLPGDTRNQNISHYGIDSVHLLSELHTARIRSTCIWKPSLITFETPYLPQNREPNSGLILGVRPANERDRCKVTASPIGWAQIQDQRWNLIINDLVMNMTSHHLALNIVNSGINRNQSETTFWYGLLKFGRPWWKLSIFRCSCVREYL